MKTLLILLLLLPSTAWAGDSQVTDNYGNRKGKISSSKGSGSNPIPSTGQAITTDNYGNRTGYLEKSGSTVIIKDNYGDRIGFIRK